MSNITEMHGPERGQIELDKVFAALSDPHRRTIVAELAAQPSGTEMICASFGIPVSKSTRTFHFRVLREAGLTYDANYGNRKGVILRRDDIDARFPGLIDLVAKEHDDSSREEA